MLAVAGIILLIPVPSGITPKSWRLLAIFAATITGSIVRPIPGAAIVLLGIAALPLFRVLTITESLTGYADRFVWLVLAAFFISRGMIKTGLGRRIAFLFIKAIGRHSLGLSYALGSTEMVLATVIPSTGARSGGIIFPIAKSLAEAYESRPGPTANRLGAFLMTSVYQCNVVVCAMFLTGQASNPIIAEFALSSNRNRNHVCALGHRCNRSRAFMSADCSVAFVSSVSSRNKTHARSQGVGFRGIKGDGPDEVVGMANAVGICARRDPLDDN